ncbi:MAG TPA: hypothetical protein DCR63_03390 [Microbacterium sp.]|nr:hypothetical protein [Microbacterium sp.]
MSCRRHGTDQPAPFCRRCRAGPSLRRPDDRGAVAAEFAITLPAALLVIIFGAGALAAAGQSVRLQGAAADAARLIARDDRGSAQVLVAQLPGRVAADVEESDRLVCVTLSSPVTVAGLAAPGLDVSARACAAAGGR